MADEHHAIFRLTRMYGDVATLVASIAPEAKVAPQVRGCPGLHLQ